ncbi:MAG: nuclear transport factor 2 family protein [Pseudomonadales bacterium]|nr:nuclear transport factor 2 family protein [Halioglobus sp.]MCP5130811.1 nuclear transport factor 2 family protein [Pseudomonadales bacterium]
MPAATEALQIRNSMIDNYNSYAQGLDTKDWAMVRSCFADKVFIDYGSISDPTGSPDVARNSEDWLPVLQGVINGFDITRHAITNHRPVITDSTLSCTAYLTADHVIFPNPELPIVTPEDVVTVVGEYTNWYEKDGSRLVICRSRLVINYTGGNLALLGQAMQRAIERGATAP